MNKTEELNKVRRMSKKDKQINEPAISDEISAAIASKIIATTPAPEVAERIKTKLMNRVKSNDHEFVFANKGEWKNISTGVEIKLLYKAASAKSFLIRMAANSSIEAHAHAHDEESFVIDGEVWLEGILCHSGDYHFEHAGSQHQKIHTTKGCTLLVKSN